MLFSMLLLKNRECDILVKNRYNFHFKISNKNFPKGNSKYINTFIEEKKKQLHDRNISETKHIATYSDRIVIYGEAKEIDEKSFETNVSNPMDDLIEIKKLVSDIKNKSINKIIPYILRLKMLQEKFTVSKNSDDEDFSMYFVLIIDISILTSEIFPVNFPKKMKLILDKQNILFKSIKNSELVNQFDVLLNKHYDILLKLRKIRNASQHEITKINNNALMTDYKEGNIENYTLDILLNEESFNIRSDELNKLICDITIIYKEIIETYLNTNNETFITNMIKNLMNFIK